MNREEFINNEIGRMTKWRKISRLRRWILKKLIELQLRQQRKKYLNPKKD